MCFSKGFDENTEFQQLLSLILNSTPLHETLHLKWNQVIKIAEVNKSKMQAEEDFLKTSIS